jgi:hypothetical protein
MRYLLIAMAIVELGAGLGLIAVPAFVATLLLGVPLDGEVALIVAHLCGAGLLSLGIACFLASGDAGSRAAAGLVVAMVFYNTIATGVLWHAAMGLKMAGMLIWPAIIVHGLLAVWCIASLLAVSRVRRSSAA